VILLRRTEKKLFSDTKYLIKMITIYKNKKNNTLVIIIVQQCFYKSKNFFDKSLINSANFVTLLGVSNIILLCLVKILACVDTLLQVLINSFPNSIKARRYLYRQTFELFLLSLVTSHSILFNNYFF
jgi:hypothetical protein